MTDKETLQENDEYAAWKKKYHGAYGVRCAYWAPSKYHMTDPMVYCKGYAAYACDIDDWIYTDLADVIGKEKASKIFDAPDLWNEYLKQFKHDIPYILQNCGVRMTLKQFYNKYVK